MQDWGERSSVKEITDRIGEHGEEYQILLAHHPGYIQEYLEYGADMILSGHYHGGVMQLPGIGGVISPDFTLFQNIPEEYTGKEHRRWS